MSAHTPGPWVVVRYSNNEGFAIHAPDVGCIAERWWPTEEKQIPIAANARLIAVAPELLEALKRLTYEYCEDAIKQAEEVIAKAEGRK